MKKKPSKKAKRTSPVKRASAKKAPKKKVAAKKQAKRPAIRKESARKEPVRREPVRKDSPRKEPIRSEAPALELVPSRAPVKKIFGAGNVVTMVLPKGAPIHQKSEPAEAHAAEPGLQPAAPEEAPQAEAPVQAAPKIPWDALPIYLPAQARFAMGSAKKECEAAASSPFPFAKFIAALPARMCAGEFSMLLLSADHDNATAARLCGIDISRVEAILSSASANLLDVFSELCSEIYRNWNAKLGSAGISPESLVEHHLVSKVDRSFQSMLAAMLLRVMRKNSPISRTLVAINGDSVN